MNGLNISLATGLQLLTIWLAVNQLPVFVDRAFDWLSFCCYFIRGLSTTIPSTTVSSTTVPSTSLCWLVNSTVNENKNGLQSSIKMLLKIADLKVPDLSFYTCLCLVFSFVLFILAFYLKCLWLFLHSLKPFITLEILGQMPQDF